MKIEMFRYLTFDNDTPTMKQESDAVHITETFEIFFPNSPEDAKTKKAVLRKLYELINGSEIAKNVKLTRNIDKKRIALDSDEFDINIRYSKKLSVLVELVSSRTNLDEVDEVMSDIMSYVNPVMGNSARESKVVSTKIVCKKKLSSITPVIGEKTLRGINQRVNKTLEPFGMMFEFKKEDRRYVIGVYSGRPAEVIYSYKDYKEPIALNFITDEHDAFKDPEKIIKKLYQVVL